jgi:hypothetical protein
MATELEVELFLKNLKEKIQFFDLVFRNRDKNQQAIFDLEITPNQRLQFILNLKIEEYYAGPKQDTYDLTKPDYYEFGVLVNDTEVYVKISMGLPNKPADCMSFHPAEFAITYPLKKKST